jgi:hypothetical protein
LVVCYRFVCHAFYASAIKGFQAFPFDEMNPLYFRQGKAPAWNCTRGLMLHFELARIFLIPFFHPLPLNEHFSPVLGALDKLTFRSG